MKKVTLGYKKEKILKGIDLKIKEGEFIGVIGPSGAGKSTLLMSLVGGIKVFDGKFEILDYEMADIGKKDLRKLREQIGFVFQGYNLVDRLTVLDNVISGILKDIPMARSIIKYYKDKELKKAKEMMDVVDISKHAKKRCDELSGGQRQRVAIARALISNPKIILADEPVSALDVKSAAKVMNTLKTVNEKYGVTVLTNLHHLEYARDYCDRIIGVNDGTIIFDGKSSELTDSVVEKIYSTSTK
jgi:phosphonate transport system ATP-binding protein